MDFEWPVERLITQAAVEFRVASTVEATRQKLTIDQHGRLCEDHLTRHEFHIRIEECPAGDQHLQEIEFPGVKSPLRLKELPLVLVTNTKHRLSRRNVKYCATTHRGQK